jgi:uncharacterized protein YdaU (DUF1376 family)
MKLHGLLWWIDRWRKSTAYTDMTLEEQGAYRNLLDEAWLRGGPLPLDERALAKASGDATRWTKLRGAVLKRFKKTDEGWRNETLDQVLDQSMRHAVKQHHYRERQKRTNGKP